MIKITADIPKDYTTIQWAISKYCDKSCHYCIAGKIRTTIKNTAIQPTYTEDELEVHEHIATMLPSLVTRGMITLFGGEPTMHPKGIEYFNQICSATKDNSDVTVVLFTHGDIEPEKIKTINPDGNNTAFANLSYHHYQVDNVDDWIQKAKLFQTVLPVNISVMIPRISSLWDEIENAIRKMMNAGFWVEIQPEVDLHTGHLDEEGLKRFSDLYAENTKHLSGMFGKYHINDVVVSDTTRKVNVTDTRIKHLPLDPRSTFCSHVDYMIDRNKIGHGCNFFERTLDITTDTTINDMLEFVSPRMRKCTNTSCMLLKAKPNQTIITNKSLDDKDIQEYINRSIR